MTSLSNSHLSLTIQRGKKLNGSQVIRQRGEKNFELLRKERKERREGKKLSRQQEIGKATDCEIGTKTKLRMGEKCQDKKLRT